jgi:hypothetical protein
MVIQVFTPLENKTLRKIGYVFSIEAPCSKLQGIFDPQGSTIYSNRSLTPQQAKGNALAPGFKRSFLTNVNLISNGVNI